MSKQALSANEQKAIADIVAVCGKELRSYVKSRVFDPAERDDIIQEVYLRLVRYEDISGIQNPSAFLFSIANNLILDRGRRARYRGAHECLVDDPPDPVDTSPSQEQSLAAENSLAVFSDLLDTLNPLARQAFLLSRVDSLTYSEIAAHMKVSQKTVEKYISQALKHLRKALPPVGNSASRASSPVGGDISNPTKGDSHA